MSDVIVKSKIKEVVPGLNVAEEVFEALNKKVVSILQDAADRAKANGKRRYKQEISSGIFFNFRVCSGQ